VNLSRQVRPLLQPARLAVICRHLAQLSLLLAALLMPPTLFAALNGDAGLAERLFVAALAPALVLGLGLVLPAAQRPLQSNEALIVVCLVFVLTAGLLTYPLMAAGLSPIDAWFEAVSGVTTTGLSMVPEPGAHSDAFLFTRSWAQWLGGLGMVVLSLALALGRVTDMRRLATAASSEEDPGQGLRRHARQVLAVYLVLTLVGLLLVRAAGLPPFEALVHTLSAVSTGGFSGFSDSLARLERPTQLALLSLAFLGALPLPLFYRAYLRGASELARDPELRALIAAVLLATLLLWLLGRLAPVDALLQALTAQTGTGFSTLEVAGLAPEAKWVLILSMATGAGIGSTAGGMKLLRLLILVRVLQLAILRAQLPRHGVLQPTLGGHVLEPAQIEHALLLLLLYPLLFLVSWLPFLAAGFPPLDALFEVVSATATVGLSTGITSADLEPGLKLLLTLDMLAGRVEILAFLVLVYPGSWYKRRSHP
jgi:trk system potassium uptake protein TrkH